MSLPPVKWRVWCRSVAVVPIVLYKYAISPLLPPACRFYPTCSVYAQQAIMTHGLVRGGWLSVRRLCRCHPWSEGGYDPVPPATSPDGVSHCP